KDGECYDDILIDSLKQYLATIAKDDDRPRLIVLHQVGSHGPAYYKRAPEAYQPFKPTCDTNAIQGCSQTELLNSYDNTIVYTDHVLSQMINTLKEISIAIIESDTNRKITNMRFFIRYKGKIKEHTSDSSGIKTGIIAEEGENLDILVNGSKGYQKLKTISITKGMENSCISVPLGLVSVKLKIHDSKGKILKNN
ncbi:sulfatase-like hydrolase/transferase, partial [Acinetobacter baumannii]|uniref:sulfatase-like hydrolase/transferase n=1 Tax=Acinetobacter baumannii TaxID=470 RepID=UPI003ED91816